MRMGTANMLNEAVRKGRWAPPATRTWHARAQTHGALRTRGQKFKDFLKDVTVESFLREFDKEGFVHGEEPADEEGAEELPGKEDAEEDD